MTYAGAIFDQDGLLFDTEVTYQRAWIEAGRRLGREIDPAVPRTFCGISPDGIKEIVRRTYPDIDVDAYCSLAPQISWSEQLSSVPVKKKGLDEMLAFCKANGIRTAVASSSVRRVVEHNLTASGVRDFFDAVVTGDEVEHGKPAPDIFVLAANRLGLDPHDCCVFEDAFSGIKGANAAGCGAVLVPDQVRPTDEIRSICSVFPDLAGAIAALR